ncbi:hypothetical protein [Kordia sp.]|uniref:hypothetical protein n=1 Tax=Kordia sp. TaxID=1965332 RepID=UPI003D6C3E62
MKYKIVLLFAITLLFQSCYTYKTASVDTLEVKKRYLIQLKRGGKEVDGKYVSRTKDSVKFRVNKTNTNFPVSGIKSIRRKKVSTIMIVGTATAVAVGTILLIDSSNDEDGDIDAIPTPNN